MTIATIRPTGDSTKTGISYSSGVSAWSLLQDNNNASYVYVANGQQWPNGYAKLDMGDIVLSGISAGAGGNNRIKACRIRGKVQLNASDPGHGASVNALFRSSVTGNQNGSTWFSTSSTVDVLERTGAWVTKHPNGVEWPQPGVNNIQIVLGWHYSVGSNHVNVRLNELYVDIDVRARPQVSGVTVTNNTTSTRPTISWTYTPNFDLDPQSWYQVKVFSAAQIAAAGFNPDTSTAAYASGEISGDADSLILDSDLSTSINYTAYVKAAQNFNGSPWYSTWATSAFSITLQPPAVPALSLTADATVPYLRNKLAVTQNLNMLTVQQSGLEDGTTTGWVVGTNCTLSSQTPIAADGQYSLQMTSSSAALMRADTTTGVGGIPVVGNQQYTAIAYVQTAATSHNAFVSIRWYDVSGALIGSPSDGTGSNDTSSFGIRTVTATSPATARFAAISMTISNPSAGGEVHYVDHCDFHVGSSTNFSPAGASTIVETAWVTNSEGNLIHPQLWTGGEEEGNANGFFASGTLSNEVYDRSDQFHGTGSIRWYVDDTTSKLYIGWPSGSEVNPSPVYPMAAVPGRPYSFSLRARASQSFSSQLNLQAIDKDGGVVGSAVNGGAIAITTSWVEYKVQNFTIPANAVWVKAYLDNTAAVTGRTMNVDACRWYQATTVPSTLEQSTGGLATSWMPVRGAAEGDLPVAYNDGKVYVHDLEVPCGYTVLYRARNVAPATDNLPAISSDPTAVISTMMDNPGVSVLSLPGSGRLRAQVRVTDDTQSRHEESETFFPLRPGGYSLPVVVSDFLGGRDGSLTIKTKTEEEWRQVNELLRQQAALWLVHPDFGARYIRITERSWEITQLDRNMTWLRKIAVPYLEVDRPAV